MGLHNISSSLTQAQTQTHNISNHKTQKNKIKIKTNILPTSTNNLHIRQMPI